MQEAYSEVNKSTQRSIKADKRVFYDNLATEAEEAAWRGEMKVLHSITKTLSGKFGKPERPVKDKDGRGITGDDGQKRRWSISRNC